MLDRFDDDHMGKSYPIKDEPDIYSTCSGCGEDIYCGDEVLDVYGMSVHDDYECVYKSIQARRMIAGEEL